MRVAALDAKRTDVRPLVLVTDELDQSFDPVTLDDRQQRQGLATRLAALAAT